MRRVAVEQPLGQRHGDARADLDDVEVLDGRQFVDKPSQRRDGQRQRIAARHNHIVNLRMLADVIGHPPIVVAGRIPAVAVQGHPLSGAEPAVHRTTDVRGDHQHRIGTAMGQTRRGRVFVFLQRIFQFQ